MVKYNKRRNTKNEELVSDPHELLLSLVDLGSIDCEDALLACVTEMSDAECKRVLSSLSLPDCCDDAEEDEEDGDLEDEKPDDLEDEESESESDIEDDELNPVADEIIDVDGTADDEELSQEESRCRDLESRIKQLERKIRSESFRRVSRRFK